MTSVISTTYDSKYLFFLPITTWCWNKLGVDVICFVPFRSSYSRKMDEIFLLQKRIGLRFQNHVFGCPQHKEATYAQCSRLYAAALDLPEDEILITSDVDMAVFKLPPIHKNKFTIWGCDLVPESQYPICYINSSVKVWREVFHINSKYGPNSLLPEKQNRKSYQQLLDELLGEIECDHFKGNYWGKDQETAFQHISKFNPQRLDLIPRAKPGTQFATNRLDRDDQFILDRLSPDIIDYHMPRPGYEDAAFNQILTVLKYFYPNDNFDWLISYRNEYIKLL